MDNASSAARRDFLCDLRTATIVQLQSVVASTRSKQNTAWKRWAVFCDHHNIPHNLAGVEDPGPYFQVFAIRVRRRDFDAHPSSLPVRAGTVAAHLSAVRKTIAQLVGPQTAARKQLSAGPFVPGVAQMLAAFAREDPPPKRVYPVNITILTALLDLARPQRYSEAKWACIIDMAIIGFYYLLRPGEHTRSSTDSRGKPFTLLQVSFVANERTHFPNVNDCNDRNREATDCAVLHFLDQKNKTKGETVAQWRTTNPRLCPVRRLFDRCRHLVELCAPRDSPLYHYYDYPAGGGAPTWLAIQASDITAALKLAAEACFDRTGIPPDRVEVRSLRAGGATALLAAGIAENKIEMMGRWRSDAMRIYLRMGAWSITKTYSQKMLDSGTYAFARNQANDPDYVGPELLPDAFPDSITDQAGAYIDDLIEHPVVTPSPDDRD